MTLEQLGNPEELIGAIAVVVSLLYLAAQIPHSSRVSRFEAHRSISDSIASIMGEFARDPELYRLWKIIGSGFFVSAAGDALILAPRRSVTVLVLNTEWLRN